MIFMLKKRPFTEEETREIMEQWSLAIPVLVPGRHADPPYDDLFSGRKSLDTLIAESHRRIDPVFDDSPFYFAIERPWGVPYRMRQALSALVLPVLALLAVFVAFGKPRRQPVGPYAASIVYFGCLGAGFIAVELSLLQNLTLLLGHPIFTLSILLFTILAAGGVGSALSGRLTPAAACLAVAVLGALAAVALPHLVPAAAAARSLGARGDCGGDDRSPRSRDGHAVSAGAAAHGPRLAPAAAVLLGPERRDVGHRLGRDGAPRAHFRIPHCDARRQRALSSCRCGLLRHPGATSTVKEPEVLL